MRGDRGAGRCDPGDGAGELPLSCRSNRHLLSPFAAGTRRAIQAQPGTAQGGTDRPHLSRGLESARLQRMEGAGEDTRVVTNFLRPPEKLRLAGASLALVFATLSRIDRPFVCPLNFLLPTSQFLLFPMSPPEIRARC